MLLLKNAIIFNERIYYLVYEEFQLVLLVATSGKKNQQEVIDAIKHLLPYYKEKIKEKFNP